MAWARNRCRLSRVWMYRTAARVLAWPALGAAAMACNPERAIHQLEAMGYHVTLNNAS
ncbi:hypothetical protein [Kribbella sindirgiensis]|uniref:hypothetical protein n=1 Tax=Kribbella sindirgiensis TaxID=1124744 RepID=UPI0013F47EF3|nr:hypothetical protein [Kribbella sindirgiensis]